MPARQVGPMTPAYTSGMSFQPVSRAVPLTRILRACATIPSAVVLVLSGLAAADAAAQSTPAPAASAASAPAGPAVRAEMGKPLQAAQEALRAKDGKAALARVAEMEAMPALTPYELYAINRLRTVAAVDTGDHALAIASLEKVLGSEHLGANERLPMIDIMCRLALQTKDMPRAVTWLTRYKEANGADPQLRRALPQVLAETNDHAGSVREALLLVQADEAASQVTPEALLRNLAFSQNKVGDMAGYLSTLERLARLHPRQDYWNELISRTERKPGFDGNRLRLDVYRLLRAVGIALEPDELADMASRAHTAGLPAEASALLEEGFAAGAFAKSKDLPALQKLRDQAAKAAAQDKATLGDSERAALANKEGNAAVNLGFAMSGAGMHDKAVSLIEQGMAKGGLRRPDEAGLHQGVALWRAGRKDDAVKAFGTVKGSDGSADLARLWSIFVALPKKPA